MAGRARAQPSLVAIVDDDVNFGRALSRLVRSHGLDVATFVSGQALLDALAGVAPDCVLLDLNLPGLAGTEVLHRLGRAGDAIPIIAMTGVDRPGLCERCVAAGASAYLTKPIGDAELVAALTGVLGAIVPK